MVALEVDGTTHFDRIAGGSPPPADPEAIVNIVRGSGTTAQVDLRLLQRNGQATLEIEVWGNGLSKEPIAEKIRAAVPEVAKSKIDEDVLEGKVRGTLGEKLGHD